MLLTLLMSTIIGATAHANETFNNELAALRFVESTDGQNTNHRVLTSGMHKGTRAGGFYGVMPITARETILKSKDLILDYGFVFALSNDQITDLLNNNRRFDNDIAGHIWAKLRRKYSVERSACSWFRGPAAETCTDPIELAQDAYTLKFQSTLQAIQAPRQLASVSN